MSDEVYVLVLSFLGSFIFFFFLFFKVGRQNIFGYYASAIVLGFFSSSSRLFFSLVGSSMNFKKRIWRPGRD